MSISRMSRYVAPKTTPQSQPIIGSNQVQNSDGCYVFPVDCWTRLERFLILGVEGGSYYATEKKLTQENAKAVMECLKEDGPRTVDTIAKISQEGRAPKNTPAIFALALAAKFGDEATRALAYRAVQTVCRTGTHLFEFAEARDSLGGWGRGFRDAVAWWYNSKPADKLAYQVIKYQQRNGWSHNDLLRLSHAKPPSASHDAIYKYVTETPFPEGQATGLPGIILAAEGLKKEKDPKMAGARIRNARLPREVVPSELLNSSQVWEALLDTDMPITAMIRNLATMTRVGVLAPMSDGTNAVVDKLTNAEALTKARIHPVNVLSALLTYKAGHGARGQHTWTPVPRIVDALDDAFYASFGLLEPSGARLLLSLDVSASMTWSEIAGVPGLTPRVASACMAMVSARTEKKYGFLAFSGGVMPLDISPKMRLDETVRTIERLGADYTNCALPMQFAEQQGLKVDTFVIYTDSETNSHNSVHPSQALKSYRQRMGIPAKLVVVGMVSNGFSIADPNDGGMMDVVGFDTSAPQIISDFSKPI